MNQLIPDNKNGFTLIEVLIAIVILSIGLLGIGQMQLMGIRGNASASTFSEAAAFGQDKMEELINLPYTHTDLSDTNGDGTAGLDAIASSDADGSESQIGATNKQYDITWNIAVDSPAAHAKHIRVHVQWSDKGRIRTISMDSIKSDI